MTNSKILTRTEKRQTSRRVTTCFSKDMKFNAQYEFRINLFSC